MGAIIVMLSRWMGKRDDDSLEAIGDQSVLFWIVIYLVLYLALAFFVVFGPLQLVMALRNS